MKTLLKTKKEAVAVAEKVRKQLDIPNAWKIKTYGDKLGNMPDKLWTWALVPKESLDLLVLTFDKLNNRYSCFARMYAVHALDRNPQRAVGLAIGKFCKMVDRLVAVLVPLSRLVPKTFPKE